MTEQMGSSMLRFFDAYSVRARFIPAILAVAPALAALFLLVPWKELDLYVAVTTVAMLALLYALSDWARKQGQALEPGLYSEIGGKPSVTMMHRSDNTIDQASKDRYRAFLAAKIEKPEPSANDEQQNPGAANAFYELAGTWLRTHTRDTKKFPILFNENCAYGFRRNLLGVKWTALALNAIVVAICAAVLVYHGTLDIGSADAKRVLVVLIVAAAHALYFLLAVNRKSVIAAARTYARELILSCETLITPQKAAPKPAKKAAAPRSKAPQQPSS